MRTILVTGADTGVGKTHVVGVLAAALAAAGAAVEIVKVVETGVLPGQPGDASQAAAGAHGPFRLERGRADVLSTPCAGGAAQRIPSTTLAARGAIRATTLFSFRAALAPGAAARAEGKVLRWEAVISAVNALPSGDGWRIFEGAGGIASPIDDEGHDWADFAVEASVERTVLVVIDRIGAIGQARLCATRAAQRNLQAAVWLNAIEPPPADVAQSTREALARAGIELWSPNSILTYAANPVPASAGDGGRPSNADFGETPPYATLRLAPAGDDAAPVGAVRRTGIDRFRADREERRETLRFRTVRVTAAGGSLNLADNDYFDLAHDPDVVAAAAEAARKYGTSASASPLITGWKEPHERLLADLCAWHGFACGMLWTSGYAANSAVLGTLPAKGDLILADRLVHHSMIAGLERSGARFQRYQHLDLDRLEGMLAARAQAGSDAAGSLVWVATESVFSMDGDRTDLVRLKAIKQKYPFYLVLDEAHGLGWYGPGGAGCAAAAQTAEMVDVFVGTLGKALASGGAYTLFRDEPLRDYLVNHAGEFIYSTGIPPANAAAAAAARRKIAEQCAGGAAGGAGQPRWHARSKAFRAALRADGWPAADGDSPIVPVILGTESAALDVASALRAAGILVGAVRPPTVPAGTSRLRFSLKSTFDETASARVLSALRSWKEKARRIA